MPKMKTFEYKGMYFGHHELPKGKYSIIDYLNSVGLEGWELVYVFESKFIEHPNLTCNYTLVLKREKPCQR